MNFVADSHIPYLRGVLDRVADVVYADRLTAAMVADADGLLVRTRTRCDASLLRGSRVKWIGTATIGTDHIDFDYCHRHGITVVSAPGCNAPAVAQWTLASIATWMRLRGIASPVGLTLGVVGVGHVGGIVARWARRLGFGVVLCDPPRARREGVAGFVSLPELLATCDVATFHTPLTATGPDATVHLLDAASLRAAPHLRLVLNAARGGICDDHALAAWGGDVALDCWEDEPRPLSSLLRKAVVATPHIAGYSEQGKRRATARLLAALNALHGWQLPQPEADTPAEGADPDTLQAVVDSYDPLVDTAALRRSPEAFEHLRNHYTFRREFAGG